MPLEVQREPSQQDQVQTNQLEEEEIEELLGGPMLSIYDKVYGVMEKFACTRIGQFVIERGDRVLRVIEDTAKWSLPQDKTDLQLARPLPWLPFLWMIVWLRIIRIWISVAALLIGNGPVSPQDVVYFIQTRRRKLRAIRVNGIKIINDRKTEENAERSGDSTNPGVIANLRKLVSSAICRPDMHYEPIRRIYISHDFEPGAEDGATENSRVSTGKRPRDDKSVDEDEDNELTADQMLTRYANQNSDDDSDFIPHANEDTNDEESNTSTVSDGSSDEGEDEGEGQNSMNQEEVVLESEIRNKESNKETAQSSKSLLDVSVEVREGDGEHSEHVRPMLPVDADIKTEPLSDAESSNEQPPTTKENGQGENREDVARITATAVHKLSSCHENEQHRKSTPGHESAAMSRFRMLPAIGTTATAVPISCADTPPFYNYQDHNHPAFSYTYSSSSTSDSDSFMTNEDFDISENQMPEHNIGAHRTATAQKNYQNISQSSDSSSEDEFYSPVGSPIDFNSIIKPVSILKKPTPLSSSVVAHSTHKPTGDADNETDTTENSPPAKKQVQHNLPHRQTQQHNQHRFRGRNRH